MKVYIILILLTLCACEQVSNNNSQASVKNEIKSAKPNFRTHSLQKDTIAFSDLKEYFAREDYIPLTIIRKYVDLPDSSIFENGTNFIGKEVVETSKYLLFHIKQGNENKGHEIFLTYDIKTKKQIAGKSFLYYCHDCSSSDLVAYPYFMDNEFKQIIVEYYPSTITKAMPKPDELTIIKKEVWVVSLEGNLSLQSQFN